MNDIKQFYKITDGALVALKQNDIYNGVGDSNLDRYFSDHPDEANAAGWYELAEVEPPAYDAETQTLEVSYDVVDNLIIPTYTIRQLES